MKFWLYVPDRIIAYQEGSDWWVLNGHWTLRLLEPPKPNGGPAKLACVSPGHEHEWTDNSVYVFEVDDGEHLTFKRCEELARGA